MSQQNNVEINTNDNYKLTTDEAIKLINALKEKVNNSNLIFPTLGKKIEFDVFVKDDGSKCVVNIYRGSINKEKGTFQGRTFINSIPLIRLDITNSCHINSDGTKIIGNHLHIYNEETELQEAIPFDINRKDLYEYCLEFFKKFNLIKEKWNIIYQEEI